jgi:hypothetical protein
LERAYGLEIPQSLEEACNPDRVALVVYDMQVGILRHGAATEIGIEPTVRHGADLGYIPIIVTDACGSGHKEAAERALASLRFTGDAYFTDVAEISEMLRRAKSAHERPLA